MSIIPCCSQLTGLLWVRGGRPKKECTLPPELSQRNSDSIGGCWLPGKALGCARPTSMILAWCPLSTGHGCRWEQHSGASANSHIGEKMTRPLSSPQNMALYADVSGKQFPVTRGQDVGRYQVRDTMVVILGEGHLLLGVTGSPRGGLVEQGQGSLSWATGSGAVSTGSGTMMCSLCLSCAQHPTQVSWSLDHKNAHAGTYEVRFFDEESYSLLRKVSATCSSSPARRREGTPCLHSPSTLQPLFLELWATRGLAYRDQGGWVGAFLYTCPACAWTLCFSLTHLSPPLP